MNDWADGYITEIDYPITYHSALSPVACEFALTLAGWEMPPIENAFELGHGKGLSINIHAATQADTRWQGNDFNPTFLSSARNMANSYGASLELHEDSLKELRDRKDLPQFDFIAIHGVWSWVSNESRSHIVEFLRSRLKAGGVAQISYNLSAGFAHILPIRNLMSLHSGISGSNQYNFKSKLKSSLDFANMLLESGHTINLRYPELKSKLAKLAKERDWGYLTHELLNEHWHLSSFSDLSKTLKAAKLQFAGPTNVEDLFPFIRLTAEELKLVEQVEGVELRQECIDFMTARQFRSDYWIKGGRRLTPAQRGRKLLSQRFVLITSLAHAKRLISTPLGNLKLNGDLYEGLLDCFSDHLPKTIAQAHQTMPNTKMAHLVEAVSLLVGLGVLSPCQSESVCAKSREGAGRLNKYLISRSELGQHHFNLACPVTGGGISVSPLSQILILGRLKGLKTPEDLVDYLHAPGKNKTAEGIDAEHTSTTGGTAPDQKAQLLEYSREFLKAEYPMYQALGLLEEI